MNNDIRTTALSPDTPTPLGRATMELSHQDQWETLSDSSEILFKSLKLGRVRGIVTITDLPKGTAANNLMTTFRELISRDILVAICSAENVTLEQDFFDATDDGLAEFCSFIGIDPVMLMEPEQANRDTADFYAELADTAGVMAADLPVAVITTRTDQSQSLAATSFTPEADPIQTADRIDHFIHDKRGGVQWCDRCGGRFSPFS